MFFSMTLVYRLLAVTLLITRVIIIYDNCKKIKETKHRHNLRKRYEDDPDSRF